MKSIIEKIKKLLNKLTLKHILVILILSIIVLVSFYKPVKNKDLPNYNTGQESPVTVPGDIPTPPVRGPSETGALDTPMTAGEKEGVEQMRTLKGRSPVVTDFFELEFSYKTIKFEVFFKDTVANNRSRFSQWLKENGYDKIDPEKFLFLN